MLTKRGRSLRLTLDNSSRVHPTSSHCFLTVCLTGVSPVDLGSLVPNIVVSFVMDLYWGTASCLVVPPQLEAVFLSQNHTGVWWIMAVGAWLQRFLLYCSYTLLSAWTLHTTRSQFLGSRHVTLYCPHVFTAAPWISLLPLHFLPGTVSCNKIDLLSSAWR